MKEDFGAWLSSLGLGEYQQVFLENAIDQHSLPHLSDEDLASLGLPLGHRRILQAAIAAEQSGTKSELDTPGDAERRQVTIMFCDLVGSTALASRLDPEDMHEVISSYHRCVAAIVKQNDGFIAKYMGDGVLVYFGYPHAQENDPERAVETGLELVRAVSRLQTPATAPLAVRVGIATGIVVVGDLVGSGASQERGVVGDTPNLAARLQTLAGPGEVIIGDLTHRLVGDFFVMSGLGEVELKGIDGPSHAWTVLGKSKVESRFEAKQIHGLVPLVGRNETSRQLTQYWRCAKAGEGQVVDLFGESGIGKSHLTAAFMATVEDEPHRRLRFFCAPQYASTPLYPVIAHLKRVAGFADAKSEAERVDGLITLLQRADTPVEDQALIAALLSVESDERLPQLSLTAQQKRKRTLDALLDWIVAISRREPVLMLLEDAHWSDPTSQELFGSIVDRIVDLPVMLMVTYQPNFDAPWSGAAHVTDLTLDRLAESASCEIIDRIVGNHELSDEVREEIIARTDGVPLFIEEVTKAVLDHADEIESSSATAVLSAAPEVPDSLHASLVAGLDRLGASKEVLQTAAAIGREFSYALLNVVARQSEEELKTALTRAENAGLIFRHGTASNPSFLFKHVLVQDAAYGLLLRGPRRALHTRIAEALCQEFPALAETEPEIVAHHYDRALDTEAASLWHERAGNRFVSRSAFAETIAHYKAALAGLPSSESSEVQAKRELRILLHLGPALSLHEGQRDPELEGIYSRALVLSISVGDEVQQFKSLWGLWTLYNLSGRTSSAQARADELLALGEKIGRDDLSLEALHCSWSTATFRGDMKTALEASREGAERYDHARHSHLTHEFGGHDAGVCAHVVIAIASAERGEMRQATDYVAQSISLARSIDHLPSLGFALLNALMTLQTIGDRKAVLETATELDSLASKLDLPPHLAMARYYAAWAQIDETSGTGGLDALEEAFSDVMRLGPMPIIYTKMLAAERLRMVQPQLAIDVLDAALEKIEEPGVGNQLSELHRLRAKALLALTPDKPEDAVLALEEAVEVARQQHAVFFELRAALELAQVCISIGDRQRATQALKNAVAEATRVCDPSEHLSQAERVLSDLLA